MADNVDDFLEHYGVKGMKWGVIRSGGAAVGRAAKSHTAYSSDRKEINPLKHRPAHTLSDAELKKVNNRLQLEKKYKDLNPNVISKGNKLAISIMAVGTTINAAIAFANTPAGKIVVDNIKKSMTSA